MREITPFLNLFRQALANLKNNDPLRMAGATAFFGFFALPPIVIIISKVLSLIFNRYQQVISGRLFWHLSDLFGARGASQLQDISRHLQPQKNDGFLMIGSVLLLLIASTTLFEVMKNSLNQLWNVKEKRKPMPMRFLRDRGIALAIIVASGLLFTVSLMIDRFVFPLPDVGSGEAETFRGAVSIGGRQLVSLITLTCWFALLFKYLPNISVRWSAVWVGALVTSVLFSLGEALLTSLLTDEQMQSVHGGAGAITLVLLLVFYCSLLFYYGAAFTRQYAQWAKGDVGPNKYAVGYQITEVDRSDA